jgi:eukaryotic-like serine/threonine-protein kinase
MDEQNRFLDNYRKKLEAEPAGGGTAPAASEPATEGGAEPRPDAAALHFEDKSAFAPPREPPAAPPPANSRHKGLVLVIVLVALALLIGAGLLWYFSRGVELIDLTGWKLADAQVWATDNNVKLQVAQAYNDSFDEGKIALQNPGAGERAKRGSFVQVTVSLGHDLTVELPLPDLMSMTKDEIDSWAATNFMSKVRMTTEYSDTVAANHVIRYEINDNTVVDTVKRNTPLYIYISKGPEQQTAEPVTLPDFKTMSVAQSVQFARDNNLTLEIVEAYDDYLASGTIMAQSVKAAENVDPGSTITITVSLGKKILLPDFSAYSKEQATAAAASLGVTITTVDRYSSKAAGKFLSQSAPAGSIYASGTIVELTYSLGNKIALASYVGQTREALETWAAGLNAQGAAIAVKVTSTQNSATKGQIIYQDPANTMISISATVRITVSLGLTVFVPDLVAPAGSGYERAITRDEALAICQELKIIPIFVEAAKTGRLPGEIWSQSLAAGSEVYEGTTLTLYYVPANVTYVVPNFTGMTQAAIEAAGYRLKFDLTFVWSDTPVTGYGDKVVAQSLIAGTTVAAGSKITLTVSPAEP